MNDLDLSGLSGCMNQHEKKKKEKHAPKKKSINVKAIKPVADTAPKGQDKRGKSWKGQSANQGQPVSGSSVYKRQPITEMPETVHAPYNFVPLWDTPVERTADSVPSWAVLDETLISGEITYELTAVTDIFTDDGTADKGSNETQQFYKNAEGRHAIPGSTIRGLIRGNAQILSLSSLAEDIEDYAMMYRNVASGIDKARYQKILDGGTAPVKAADGHILSLGIVKNVQAGYLVNQGGEYFIYPTAVEKIHDDFHKMNYYVLSERRILDEYTAARQAGTQSGYAYLVENDEIQLQHLPAGPEDLDNIEKELAQKRSRRIQGPAGNFIQYYDVKKDVNRKDPTKIIYHYKGKTNPKYHPGYYPVSYDLKEDRIVTAIGAPGVYAKEGYVLLTGPMQEKKAVYIIPEINTKKSLAKLPFKDVKSFQIDYNKRLTTIKKHEEFFNLPEEGLENKKPVFYIESAGRWYFGYAPHLRLFYEHTVHAGLGAAHKGVELDYCKAIFGCIGKTARRGRVSFSDAVQADRRLPLETRSFVLANPKPTDCLNYLERKGAYPSTYNDDEFRLRGVKQYHLRESAARQGVENDKENIKSNFQALPAETVFTGTVRFRNLTENELGLLLWSLTLEENSLLQIGKAKPYGYGAVKLTLLSAKEFCLEKAYDLSEGLPLEPYNDLDTGRLIAGYKKEISEKAGCPIDRHPAVKAFMAMKDPRKRVDEKYLSYMVFDEIQTQKRYNAVLPRLSSLYLLED